MLSIEGIRLVESHAHRTVNGCRSLQALLKKRTADVKELPKFEADKQEELDNLKKAHKQIKLVEAKIAANKNRQRELQELSTLESDEDVSDDEYKDPNCENRGRHTEDGIQTKLQELQNRLTVRSDKNSKEDDGGLEGCAEKARTTLRALVPTLPELRYEDVEYSWPGLTASESSIILRPPSSSAFDLSTSQVTVGPLGDGSMAEYDPSGVGGLSPIVGNYSDVEGGALPSPVVLARTTSGGLKSPSKADIIAQRLALEKHRKQLEDQLIKLGESLEQ